MPDRLPCVRLGDVAADRAGSFVDGPFGSNLKSSEYTDSGVRLIQLQNIGNGVWRNENRKFISRRKFDTLSRHGAKPGDIAIAKMADPVARACLLPQVADQFVVVADCMKLTPDDARFDAKYLVYAINSTATREEAERKSTGTTRLRINLTALKTVRVAAPPLSEQRQIAEILDSLDEAIRKTEAIIAKLKQVKQGLLHDLLTHGIDDNGELRDPERHPEQFKDSPLGRIPREWEAMVVGALAKVTVGHVGPIEEHYTESPDGLPLLSTSHIRDDGTIDMGWRKITRAFDRTHSKSRLVSGDLIVARHGKSGRAALIPSSLARAQSLNVVVVKHSEAFIPGYLVAALNHPSARQRLLGGQAGSVQAIVGTKGVAALRLPVPSLQEQALIAARREVLLSRIAAERRVVALLARLKQGLMEDLLTGRVRVTNLLGEAAE